MSASQRRLHWPLARRGRRLYPARHVDVIILAARYGAGHWQVASAVREALQLVHPGQESLLLDYMELVNPALNRTVQSLYLASIKHFPEGYGWFYRATSAIPADSPFQALLNSLGRERLARMISETSPRAIISTFPTQAGVLSDMKRLGQIHVPTVTVITDNTVHSQWIHSHTDLYCVSSAEVAANLLARGVEPSRVAVTGIPVREAFRGRGQDRDEIRRRYRFDPQLPVVLVMSGAFGALGGVDQACRALTHMGRPLQVVVVCGRDRVLAQRLQRTTRHYPRPVHVFGYVEAVADLMAVSDLLVTKAGGVTTAEALAMGIPTVIFRPIPGQEEANADFLERHGAALSASNSEELQAVCGILLGDPAARMAMAGHARAIGQPDAARRVASLALGLSGLAELAASPTGTRA